MRPETIRSGRTVALKWGHPLAIALVVLTSACAGGGTGPILAPSSAPQTSAITLRPPTAPVLLPADDGATVVSVTAVDERTRDVRIDSPAVGNVVVRLVLPTEFDQRPEETWPTLYLLHGANGDHADWSEHVGEATTDELSDVLVVQPDGGTGGWYSDWWNGGNGGRPMWETFHLTELPQILERNWRAGEPRAVAGISMGGYGAMEYATRRAGYFSAAASISGPLAISAESTEFTEFLTGLGARLDDLWGNRTDQADVWAAHDPWVNASQLAGTDLFISYGNGEPGPFDNGQAGTDTLEAWIAGQNDLMSARLAELDIDATIDAYGPGSHSGLYFRREWDRALPLLSAALHG